MSSAPTALRSIVAVIAALVVAATGASAAEFGTQSIEPGARVNGMFVVQGVARETDAALFADGFCDPIVLTPGNRVRSCRAVPPSRRLFVGYGIWGLSRKIVDAAWKKQSWGLWIDGQKVSLSSFGTSDHWIPSLPAANGRTVLLREWAIVLVRAKGRHTIRYANRLPQGTYSTTWKFTVTT